MVCHNREQLILFFILFLTPWHSVLVGGKIYQVKVNMVKKKHTQEINK